MTMCCIRGASLRALALSALVALGVPVSASAQSFLVAVTDQQPAPRPAGDVLEVAAASGQFQTFLRAVRVAGYEDTLRGPGPFTVFAPTDEAFSQMDRRELERLMSPRAHEELVSLIAYHVVPSRVTTASESGHVVNPTSSNGHRIRIDGRDGLRVNDQLVVVPDLDAKNGVLQGINTVLAPPTLVASR